MHRPDVFRELFEKPLTPEILDGILSKAETIRSELPLDRYYLKAMNCPHHHKLFASTPRSYRDLPLRLAEYGTCYRYEKSGELFGLMRVRSLQMTIASPSRFVVADIGFAALNRQTVKSLNR